MILYPCKDACVAISEDSGSVSFPDRGANSFPYQHVLWDKRWGDLLADTSKIRVSQAQVPSSDTSPLCMKHPLRSFCITPMGDGEQGELMKT